MEKEIKALFRKNEITNIISAILPKKKDFDNYFVVNFVPNKKVLTL